ncbi:putative ribonuclease H-like domain-containing protein [Tanacetum coccineum]
MQNWLREAIDKEIWRNKESRKSVGDSRRSYYTRGHKLKTVEKSSSERKTHAFFFRSGEQEEIEDQSLDEFTNSNCNNNTNEADNTAYGVSAAHTQCNPTSGDNLSGYNATSSTAASPAAKSFVNSSKMHMTGNKCYLTEYEDYDGGFVSFGDGKGRISGKVPRKDNIYNVDLKSIVPTKDLTCLFAKAIIDESNLWHRRLGHINFKNMIKLVKGNLVRGLPSKIFENDHSCVACQKGKQHKASCKAKLVNSISKPLNMLHMDLFGPTNVKNVMKKSYCLVVTDDFSRFSWVFFLATKDEISGILKTFITEIENQLDHKVKVIRSDNGIEFKNSVMNQFCEMKGIKREFNVARTPRQNGVAERRNRTLIEAARTMLVKSKLPTTFCAEAVNTACYVLNRVLVIKPHTKTPYELIRGRTPLIDFKKPFGCPVTILNTIDHLGKSDEKADEAWYETLSTYLIKNGFRRGTIDKTLFIKKDKGDILLVQVYVDDIIFRSTKKSLCDEFEGLMHKRFQMSSMGELTFFLGLQVQQKEDGIFISQDKYVAEILKKFDFATVKTTSTPMEPNKALVKDEEADSVDVHLYRSMIGSLMYLTASRPDITFAVCACARFQVTPKTSHLHAVKRIFRYLKGQPKLGLWYPRDSPFDLEAFSDSDYAGASLDRKSTTGGCQFLGKRLISWQCKKQTIVANSTTEAEYVAAANCCGQVLWIQNQMLDYGFNFMNTKIYIDNESTICIMKNPVFHSKTKHIEIRHHFIRDFYEKRLIQVPKIHTDHNVADLLTKGFDVSSAVNYTQGLFGLKLEGKYDDQLLNTVGLSFHYLKKLRTAVLPGLLYADGQKLVLLGIKLVLPGKLSNVGLPLEEVLLEV